MSELLLEIGTEEIPAWMIPGAQGDLLRRFGESLSELGLEQATRLSVEATPRRLVLIAKDLPPRQPDQTETRKGPSRRVAFDAAGNPTRAALGFARKAGVAVEELETADDGKLMLRRRIPGRSARELLAESLPQVVLGIRFPRSMYWTGKGGPRFIRPIRWLLALLDGEVLPIEIAGLTSTNQTWGHRRLGGGPLAIRNLDEYHRVLADNAVLLSAVARRRKIVAESEALLPPDCHLRCNTRLLETLVYETEWPATILGSFDVDYLQLPEEVLETVMLVHQKYFAVEDNDGKMTNRFLAVANARADAGGNIRRGHERVLRARFNDARFFWEFDQRRQLVERLEDLKTVLFQASLGSYWEKTETNLRAAADLAEALQLDVDTAEYCARATQLAKCDLTTEMVGEFPELQGKIGGLYASEQGKATVVAEAIYDHYLPIGASGELPRTPVGCVSSLADKLATLGGMFRLGMMPTGSKDPLALRRAAFGVIRIVVEGELPLSLDQLVEIARPGSNGPSLREFLLERLRHWLHDCGGFAHDVIQAVLAASDKRPVDVRARAEALAAVRETPDFESLAVSFKRIRNILAQAGGADAFAGRTVASSLLEEGAEAGLYEATLAVAASIGPSVAATDRNLARPDYAASLREIAVLRPALDRYFDDVLVMTGDDAIRNNRLAFLAGMLGKLSTIADFAAIAPEPSRNQAR